MAWYLVYKPKQWGGLGIRNLKSFYKDLLSKNIWRLLNEDVGRAHLVGNKYLFGLDRPWDMLSSEEILSGSCF